MRSYHFNPILPAVIISILLASCGGGNNNNPSPPQQQVFVPVGAEGQYSGSTFNSAGVSYGNDVHALILEDGTFYSVWSEMQKPGALTFMTHGKGSVQADVFRSSQMRVLSFYGEPWPNPQLSLIAPYVQGKSLNAGIEHLKLAEEITRAYLTYDPLYEQAAKLTDIAGSYSGTTYFGNGANVTDSTPNTIPIVADATTFTVAASGAISGKGVSGCVSSGTLKTHAKANVFDVSFVFGDAPCVYAKTTVTGHAFIESKTKRLYVMTMQADNINGAVFAGLKN